MEIQGIPADDTDYSMLPIHGIDGRNDNKSPQECFGVNTKCSWFNN